ncbi:polysaccharide deacetylase [Sulfobacillus thermotolerans]|uniref:Polysaccharide deacetylase n=1 Tax=Sulfobacillus thermotolerans TaxID=338644 RepID=A0ABM6RQP2_9FIRM|nr:polysaccharide deacetylase [Sulfobacillus thermotolerans]
MWIKVISLRSPATKVVALFLLFLASVAIFHSPATAPVPTTENLEPGPVYRVVTTQRAMALTINVVWGTQYVPQLLQALTAAHVKATFMVGGVWAKKNPTVLEQIVKDGMQVGNHGWAHGHPATMSVSENVADIQKTNEIVHQLVGVTPAVYAPPYGELGGAVLKATSLLHMPLVMWTIDTIDWRPSSSVPYMVNKVLAKARPGAIVLMHPTDRTVKALPLIIEGLKSQGYNLVTVSALLKMGTPVGDG